MEGEERPALIKEKSYLKRETNEDDTSGIERNNMCGPPNRTISQT